MKPTSGASLLGLRSTARPRLLPGLAAILALTMASATTSLALSPPASASVVPAPGVISYGNDISWPQCPKSQGGFDLPGPQATATFVVIGLTDGGSFRANPCVRAQVAAAQARHLWTGAYAISSYPTAAQLARYGGTGSLATRLARVGHAQAAFNIATMRRVGLRSPIVWVDIEHRPKAPWSASKVNNNMVINGVLAGYKARGMRTGIYSYLTGWREITGGRVLPGVPTWVPVGRRGGAVAGTTCALASYSGSKPWLTQWTDGKRDYNRTCPNVAGRAARGNILNPYLNVRLALGSRGTAVAALQRRLGGLKVDGVFGPLTRTKVVAFQRTKHLTANGIVTTPVWRALGAGVGPYIPPVRGIMGSVFAPT